VSIRFSCCLLSVLFLSALSTNAVQVRSTPVDRLNSSFMAMDQSPASLFDLKDRRKKKPVVTPEPASLVLLGAGLLGLAARMGRTKKENA
jgi:hypothetical protein